MSHLVERDAQGRCGGVGVVRRRSAHGAAPRRAQRQRRALAAVRVAAWQRDGPVQEPQAERALEAVGERARGAALARALRRTPLGERSRGAPLARALRRPPAAAHRRRRSRTPSPHARAVAHSRDEGPQAAIQNTQESSHCETQNRACAAWTNFGFVTLNINTHVTFAKKGLLCHPRPRAAVRARPWGRRRLLRLRARARRIASTRASAEYWPGACRCQLPEGRMRPHP